MAIQTNNLAQTQESITTQQRAEMLKLLDNELKRRGQSGNRNVNAGLSERQKLNTFTFPTSARQGSTIVSVLDNQEETEARRQKIKQLEEKIEALKQEYLLKQVATNKNKMQSLKNNLNSILRWGLALVLILVGTIRLALPEDLLDSLENKLSALPKVEILAQQVIDSEHTPAENKILLALDKRRVELENRKQELDKREQELALQDQILATKAKELKTLYTELQTRRAEKDKKALARLEQLAEVYGSIAPEQAAPIIAKLDDETALSLLEHMTGKRMGQILSAMSSERAIELTKGLKQI
ncbi:MAG: hypothetical protein LBE20_01865 [Deltaproteobacteria bacterium]|jgi:flagellar motility protein MotE (MotC chaperone)|nr:hypothetical protein [Deltaproteobacteria bacterium]